MTLRVYGRQNDLTDGGATSPGLLYTNNIPNKIKRYFPMYGTQNINGQSSNALKTSKPLVAFMFLIQTTPATVPDSEWSKIIQTGNNYLGDGTGSVEVYERFFDSGDHTLDDTNRYYLFRPSKRSFSYARCPWCILIICNSYTCTISKGYFILF